MKVAIKLISMWIVTNVTLLLTFALFVNILGVKTTVNWEAIPAVVYVLTLIASTIFVFVLGTQISDGFWRDRDKRE